MMLIGYDNGMGNNKIVYKVGKKEYTIDFQSRAKKIDSENPDALYIESIPYSFVEGRLAVDNGHNTKDDSMHQLLLYKGLYEVHKATGETEFDISMNCSLDSYKEDKGRAVKNRMLENKTIKIKEKYKEEVEIKINRLEVSPEALVGGLLCKLKLREEDVIFNDIGTKNFTILQVVNGTPLYETSFATKEGMSKIYKGVADRLKDYGLGSPSAVQMYFEKTSQETHPIMEKVDEIILTYLIETVFSEIDTRLEDLNISIFTKLVFLGGGSVYLKRFLEAKYTEREILFVEDGYFANARGLYKRGERLFGYINQSSKKVGDK